MAQKRKAADALGTAAAAAAPGTSGQAAGGGGGGGLGTISTTRTMGGGAAAAGVGLGDHGDDHAGGGQYSINFSDLLGSGEFGDVFAGTHRKSGAKVAVKVFKKTAMTNGISLDILREVKLLVEFQAAGSHPNIISLLEFRRHEGNLATVMDFCFTDLRHVIDDVDNDLLSEADVKCYTLQMLRGLEWLHRSWCLHRDLKPENLLISPEGLVKVTDFGLSSQFASGRAPRREEVVTLPYRSPELLFAQLEPLPVERGRKVRTVEFAPALDMWSAGCILGEMLQRKVVFPAFSASPEAHLETVFQMCGTPTDANWPGHRLVPGFAEFEPRPKNNLAACFGAVDRQLVNLLLELLQLSPQRRLSARNALRHAVFLPGHRPPTSVPAELDAVRRYRLRRQREQEEKEEAEEERRLASAGGGDGDGGGGGGGGGGGDAR